MVEKINSLELSVNCENRGYVSIGLEDTVDIDLNPSSNPEIDIDETNIGKDGKSATITVGEVTTLPAGSDATVENVGTENAAIFDFGIPKGDKGEKGDRGEKGEKGEQGIQGIQGEKGDKGDKGDKGNTGNAATIEVGTVSTLPAGSSATVTNAGSTGAAIFNFGIPKGDKGEKGDTGNTGATGQAATIAIGTVTTLLPNQSAYVNNSGTSGAAIFNFGIPKGDTGDISNLDAEDVINALGYTPYSSSNPSGYQANVIETVKVNGTALTPSNKAVDISVPTDSTISGWGFTKNTGTVTTVNNVSPVNGNVTLTIPTTTAYVTTGSTAALTSGGAYTNLVSTVRAHAVDANKIVVEKAGISTGITINNVANADSATKLGSSTVGASNQIVYLNNGTPTAGSTVSTAGISGSYNDLIDQPTIPNYTAGNGIEIENDEISVDSIQSQLVDTVEANKLDTVQASAVALETLLSLISGYDSTKTQSLKNVQGVIQWVDD